MRCQNCSAENPQGAKFCIQCAAPLSRKCGRCGADNPAEAKFCAQCATPLDAVVQTRAEGKPGGGGLSGERRHLTVLFCDLVGSTALAAQLDPEEWRAIVADYHRAAAQAIEHFGGYVAHYLGDGVMAYFGYPEAHDNDAERALRAGLALLDAIARLNEQTVRPKLSARVGIDSGAVVIGASAGKEADVFGDAPNIAARVQAAAEPDTVVISDATHRLVAGLFVVEDRGPYPLKGVDRPVQLYRVVQPSGVRGRLGAAAASRGLTPFVGREDELRLLLNRWERVLEGEGQVALIVGEAGIGKSRLVHRFREHIAGTPHSWVEAAAGPFFQNTPFYAVAEMLRELLAWEERLVQLETRLGPAGGKSAEALELVAPLMNPAIPVNHPPSPLPPEQQRRRLLATLVEQLLGAARTQPLVIATEDLHWADPSTLELIQLLVEQGATSRLLLLYTARPEFRAQWPLRAHHTQITLNRLSARNVRTMVEEVAARAALSDETIKTVVERTGGVPLFVEELTRAVLESGDANLSGRAIPVTLHDSLMARLDRLGPAKEVAQVGAVIGSEFSYQLLRAIHPIAEEDLQRALRTLADAELIYVRGIAPDATYQFKHALIRDVAYEALLRSRRKDLHRLVARTIDERFPAIKEAHPEVVARHWTEAGEIEPAIAEWSRAGKAAESRNAFNEALESYRQALALIALLPESSERDSRELEFRLFTSNMLWITKGWASREAVDATERAAALAERSGNLKQLINLLLTKGANAHSSGDSSAADALADRALDLARREGNPIRIGIAHTLQVMARHFRGDLAGAEEYYTAGLKFFDDPGFRKTREPRIATFAYASWNAWMLGRADVARERMARMIVNEDNPYEVAHSEYYAACLRNSTREYEQVQALAAHALDLSEKNRIPSIAAVSRIALGHALAQLGRPTEGIVLIRRGIADVLEMGAQVSVATFKTLLARAQERAGVIVEALETVEGALQANPDELAFRPETLRVRGELQLKQGRMELAEADFREAIALAQSMSAKAWELRASMSLARLLRDSGRREEARAMLADIYGWFTEGFDTADLKDAKLLLDELNA
jgi:class 3 adenylate cyclase/tetratricopeptide (TPR) repeat protein